MKIKLILALLLLCSITRLTAQTNDVFPLKLRAGTYNVGHFNQGELGGYQGAKMQEEMQRWRTWIGKQSLDIFGVNEWNVNFDKDGTMDATTELLKPFYNNLYFGAINTWIYNGIATNFTLQNIRQFNLWGEYYAIIGDLKIGKKTVTVMSVHVPWQKESKEQAVKDLITEMKKYEYLICMGDMNADDKTQLHYQEEGFNIANGGYEGWYRTAGSILHLDNIITSPNIKIMNVSAPETGLNDLDHLPVIADLIITW
jgi:endonuclease/exonuclease/phosphatase family metal-dependent hydrolase